MSITREAARDLGRDVLVDKVREANQPGLTAEYLDMAEEGFVGYALAMPHGDRQIVSRPALRQVDVEGRETFEHMFDEGLRVMLAKRDEVSA